MRGGAVRWRTLHLALHHRAPQRQERPLAEAGAKFATDRRRRRRRPPPHVTGTAFGREIKRRRRKKDASKYVYDGCVQLPCRARALTFDGVKPPNTGQGRKTIMKKKNRAMVPIGGDGRKVLRLTLSLKRATRRDREYYRGTGVTTTHTHTRGHAWHSQFSRRMFAIILDRSNLGRTARLIKPRAVRAARLWNVLRPGSRGASLATRSFSSSSFSICAALRVFLPSRPVIAFRDKSHAVCSVPRPAPPPAAPCAHGLRLDCCQPTRVPA